MSWFGKEKTLEERARAEGVKILGEGRSTTEKFVHGMYTYSPRGSLQGSGKSFKKAEDNLLHEAKENDRGGLANFVYTTSKDKKEVTVTATSYARST